MSESGVPISIVCCCGGYLSLQGMVTFVLTLVFMRMKKMREKANWMLKLGTLGGVIAMVGILVIALIFVDDLIVPADLLILIQLAVIAFLAGFGICAIVGYAVAAFRSRKAVSK